MAIIVARWETKAGDHRMDPDNNLQVPVSKIKNNYKELEIYYSEKTLSSIP